MDSAMYSSAYFIGANLAVLVIVGLAPILIGGFNPFGKRATHNRTVFGWLAALLLGFGSLGGGYFLIPVVFSLLMVTIAWWLNRSRPAAEHAVKSDASSK